MQCSGILDRVITAFECTRIRSFLFTDKMEFPGRFAVLNILCSLVRGNTAHLAGDTYFTSTPKPLQCHEIKHIHARSTVDCALYCKGNLYFCAGYVHDYNTILQFQCDVCYIYDETSPLVTISASKNKIISMPELNKETGGILDELNAYVIRKIQII